MGLRLCGVGWPQVGTAWLRQQGLRAARFQLLKQPAFPSVPQSCVPPAEGVPPHPRHPSHTASQHPSVSSTPAPQSPSHLLWAAGRVPATPPPARERLARATCRGHWAQGCRLCCRWRGSCAPCGSQCEWPLARPPEGGYKQGVQVPVLPGLGAQVGSLPAS